MAVMTGPGGLLLLLLHTTEGFKGWERGRREGGREGGMTGRLQARSVGVWFCLSSRDVTVGNTYATDSFNEAPFLQAFLEMGHLLAFE